ncbi:MAG: MFS transporter [Acidimicrobiales bacterium]
MTSVTRNVAAPDVMHRRRWLTLIVVCVSLMVIGVDNTILNVALPTLGRQLHAPTSSLQWIVDSYTLVFAGLLLTAGSLGDRFGRYKTLTLGLVIFGVGSLASALSGSTGVLIATRSFMGIGGAFIMPATLSILSNTFTEPVERSKAIGLWAGVSALGVGMGPLAGGFLLSHFFWGAIFLVNIPVVVAALIGGWFFVPDSRDPSAPRLDPIGAVLSIVGLATLLWAVIEAPSHGWGAPEIVASFAVGIAVLLGFVFWELHSSHPMLDMRFFKDRRFSAASSAIAITFFTLFGSLFLMTQYFQSVLGFSTLKAGAMLLPQAGVMMVCAPLSSVFVQRIGSKYVVGFGLSVVAFTLVWISRLGVHESTWHIVPVTMMLGLGMSQVFAPATDSIMGSLPKEKAGVGSAMNDTTRQAGGAVGVAVLGSILASRFRTEVAHGTLVNHLPVAAARTDLQSALAYARTAAGRPYAAAIQSIAKKSFVDAFHLSVLLGAAIMVVTAVGIMRWLPHRARAGAMTVSVPPIEVALDVA